MQCYPWKKESAGGGKYSSAGVDPSGSAGEYRNNQMERVRELLGVWASWMLLPLLKMRGYSSFLNALRKIVLCSCSSESTSP